LEEEIQILRRFLTEANTKVYISEKATSELKILFTKSLKENRTLNLRLIKVREKQGKKDAEYLEAVSQLEKAALVLSDSECKLRIKEEDLRNRISRHEDSLKISLEVVPMVQYKLLVDQIENLKLYVSNNCVPIHEFVTVQQLSEALTTDNQLVEESLGVIELQRDEAIRDTIQYKRKLNEADAKIASLITRIETQEKEIDDLRYRLEDANYQVSEQLVLFGSVRNLAAAENKISDTEENTFLNIEDCDRFKYQESMLVAQIALLKVSLRHETSLKRALNDELNQKSMLITTLENKICGFESECRDLECSYSTLCKEKIKIEKKNAYLRSKCEVLECTLDHFTLKFEKLTAAISNFQIRKRV